MRMIVLSDQDTRWTEGAMDDPFFVGIGHPLRDLLHKAAGSETRQRRFPLHEISKGRTFHVPKHEVGFLFVFSDLMQRYDMGVVQLADGAYFLRPVHSVAGGVCTALKNSNSHPAFALGIRCEINDT
jgi:hypothetical protein